AAAAHRGAGSREDSGDAARGDGADRADATARRDADGRAGASARAARAPGSAAAAAACHTGPRLRRRRVRLRAVVRRQSLSGAGAADVAGSLSRAVQQRPSAVGADARVVAGAVKVESRSSIALVLASVLAVVACGGN